MNLPSTILNCAAASPRSVTYCKQGKVPKRGHSSVEAMMRNARWLTTAGFVVATAGCVETAGYPTTSYGYGQPGYGYSQRPATATTAATN